MSVVHPTPPAFAVPTAIDLGRPAWIQHTPFLASLMVALAPRTFVELGVHTGNSFFAACETVQRHDLGTRCFAVDTWQGDEHAGHYGDEVFEQVQQQSGAYAFSELLRMRFDEALDRFPDGSIDLLHLDGRHFFADIKEDFESWRPKLSARAVALFHDIHVYERDFGVAAYWEQVRDGQRAFEFHHGHGLGVLLVGGEHPPTFLAWFEGLRQSGATAREAYFRLGEAVLDHHLAAALAEERDGLKAERDVLARERPGLIAERDHLRADRDRSADDLRRLRGRRSVRLVLRLASRLRWLVRLLPARSRIQGDGDA